MSSNTCLMHYKQKSQEKGRQFALKNLEQKSLREIVVKRTKNSFYRIRTMISIIIPVYNVKLYLDNCIQSVIQQSYTDFECILVDDGSTDGSSEICDQWAEKDNRIIIVHQPNGGVSSARNKGLEQAKGEYICLL